MTIQEFRKIIQEMKSNPEVFIDACIELAPTFLELWAVGERLEDFFEAHGKYSPLNDTLMKLRKYGQDLREITE